MHTLSLGDRETATAHWEQSLAYAQAIEPESPADITPDASFSVLLGHGYLAIGRADSATLAAVLAAFHEQCKDSNRKEDAELGISQLELVAARYP
ncbi:MAG: hypothetical protein ACI8W8_001123 [Rhodothermales bacterium]|jgi:hypothetical protein